MLIDIDRATFDELSTEPAGVSSEQYAIVQKFVLAAYGEDGYDTIEDLRFDSLRYFISKVASIGERYHGAGQKSRIHCRSSLGQSS